VVKRGLCTGCGTCVGMCPQEAIEMFKDNSKGIYVPYISMEKCSLCGVCFKVCPGHFVDFKNERTCLMGETPSYYLGHAIDHNVRYNSSSGGIVTALLLHALEKGIIDGVLVTKMSKDNPLEPESFIARTKEDIISASKSKYCPVPANIVLKEILKEEGKFAVVGLPCHIHGIRKAERFDKRLKDKIILHLSLFCGHNDTFLQTDFFLQKKGVKKQNVAKIDYRGDGWPGMITVLLKNGSIKKTHFSEYIGLHSLWFFAIRRCKFCFDMTGELSDISSGDAWLPSVMNQDTIGTSIVISRTRMSARIIQEAIREKKLSLKNIELSKVEQSISTITRKRDVKLQYLLPLGRAIPNYNVSLFKPRITNYIRVLMISFNIWISTPPLVKFVPSFFKLEKSLFRLMGRSKKILRTFSVRVSVKKSPNKFKDKEPMRE